MKHASTAAIAVVLMIFCVVPFQIVAFAQTGRTAPSPPSPAQTCRACVLALSSCLRRCNEQHKSTSDRLKCVNACNESNRCVRGVTCKPESP